MRRSLSLLLALLLPVMLFGQETLRVKDYGVDQGLPQSTVWDIVQDDYGFLWLGTAEGLCRFDGYTFNTYRNNPQDSLSIGGNTMYQLAVDSKGDAWLTHDQGFDKYDAATGRFTSLFRYDALRTSVFNKTFGEDKNGFVWAWLGGEGLLKFDRRTNRKVGTFKMEGPDTWRNEEYCRDGLLDNHGQIWMIPRNTTLVSFNTANDKFKIIDVGIELGALCMADDSVLLGGTKKGVIRYNTIRNKFETILFNPSGSETYQTTRMIRVNADEYWVGTTKGIFVYNDKLRAFSKHYTSSTGGKENFLFVQTLFMDHSGNIWIGTNGDGLKKHSPSAVPWKSYRSTSDRGEIVKAIYTDDKDLVFAGYYDNGIDLFSKTKGFLRKIRKGQTPPNLLPSDMVYAVSGIRKSELFISFAGVNNAFGLYDYKKQKFHDLSADILKPLALSASAGNPYPTITPVGLNTILINYRDALILGRFPDNKNPEFMLLKQFPNEAINCICKDSNGAIWVGTLNGFYSNQPGSKAWIKGTSLSKQIKTICEDGHGNLWMGTTSGLYVVNRKGEIEKEFKAGDPLVNEYIYGILRDARGDMWFSHNAGLTRYDPRRNTFRNFSTDDGLQANEFNTGAYYKSAAGELFFGGIHGVNSFFPDDIKDNLQIPRVQITRIEVHDKPLVSKTVNWAQRTVTVGHTDNTLAFEFAGLEFTDPAKNQYAWRMSGVDDNWVYSSKRFARYPNLSPGEYTFEVKASNNDGLWNEVPTAISIVIIPPYWQTWWFRVLELTAGATVVAIIAYMISRQRYQRKLQALEVQQKIHQDRGRISRELHDNIGAQLSLISSNLEWITDAGTVLTDNERKVRIRNINELSKEITGDLRETIWALNKEAITFLDFTDRLKKIAQRLVSLRPGVHLVFSDHGEGILELTPEEALNLLRICQEAIHNAVKHSEMNTLQVGWKCQAGHYEIFVMDNGKGFSNGANHKDHYGLGNVKKRAAEIGALAVITTGESGTTVAISK